MVVGGFHLFNPGNGEIEPTELVDAIAGRLKDTGTLYYTCHCTGLDAYWRMKESLGQQIQYASTGSEIEIGP